MKKIVYRCRKILCLIIEIISLAVVFYCLFKITNGYDITYNSIKTLIFLTITAIADFIRGVGKDETWEHKSLRYRRKL